MYILNDIISFIVIIIVCVLFLLTPLLITIINIVKFIEYMKKKIIINTKLRNKLYNIDLWTIGIGIIFNIFLWSFLELKDFSEPLMINHDINVHSPIQGRHMISIVFIMITGYGSYIFMRIKRTKLPPLVFVIGLSSLLLTNYMGILIIIQLSKNLFTDSNFIIPYINPFFYMMLLPFNFILCSILLVKKLNHEYVTQRTKNIFKNKFLQYINNILAQSNNWSLVAFVLSFPLIIIMIIILVLFGQQPDSIIKAFTETSDWTLSQQVSPPPISYNGHYLCTVSLRGHKKIVKPKRYGIRGGRKIVVNRQLMIANAFEEVVQEKTPNVHKFIRNTYDKYGLPLSKVITSKIRADIVYFIMKPFEYLFLIFLYLVDVNPETRIEKQYLPSEY